MKSWLISVEFQAVLHLNNTNTLDKSIKFLSFIQKNSRHVKNHCAFMHTPTPQYKHVLRVQT